MVAKSSAPSASSGSVTRNLVRRSKDLSESMGTSITAYGMTICERSTNRQNGIRVLRTMVQGRLVDEHQPQPRIVKRAKIIRIFI
jgi:hypothetical protein